MNPTPVATISNGVQQTLDQKQEVLPEEFEAQLAGYLEKEKPGAIHKETSDSKEMNKEEAQEETTEEIPILDSPLLYAGLFNLQQEQSIESSLSEQPENEVNQLLGSSNLNFSAQMDVENEKIGAFVQIEDQTTNSQPVQLEESSVEPLSKEVSEPRKSLSDQTVIMEEPSEKVKQAISKPESINRIQGEPLVKDVDNLLLEETSLIEMEQVPSITKKETEIADSILSNGRFLTAEWKSGRMTEQTITEPVESTVHSLTDAPVQLSESAVVPKETINQLANNSGQKQTETDTFEDKLKGLIESVSKETTIKESVSSKNNLESHAALTQITEDEIQGKPIQQQTIVDTSAVKQSKAIEPAKQAVVQMVNDVMLEQAETVLSGKQSVARVTLTPERMGEVNIRVEMVDNVLQTKIVVDNLETRELLTTGMHHLTDNLDRQNIRLGELTIQLNENATASFTSQERHGEEKKGAFGQQQNNFSDNERETIRSEEKTETDTNRLSILV